MRSLYRYDFPIKGAYRRISGLYEVMHVLPPFQSQPSVFAGAGQYFKALEGAVRLLGKKEI